MKKLTLFYAYDVLCGWCFGFGPAMQGFLLEFGAELDLHVINGGMVTGERVGPIGEVAGYISEAYKDVEERTGIVFGEAFLNGTMKKGTAVFDSIPLAKAHLAMTAQDKLRSYEFSRALHNAIYVLGIEPRDMDALKKVAEELGLDGERFLADFDSETVLAEMNQGFALCQQLEVRGFPTLVLANEEGNYVKFASGALPLEHLREMYGRAKAALEG